MSEYAILELYIYSHEIIFAHVKNKGQRLRMVATRQADNQCPDGLVLARDCPQQARKSGAEEDAYA